MIEQCNILYSHFLYFAFIVCFARFSLFSHVCHVTREMPLFSCASSVSFVYILFATSPDYTVIVFFCLVGLCFLIMLSAASPDYAVFYTGNIATPFLYFFIILFTVFSSCYSCVVCRVTHRMTNLTILQHVVIFCTPSKSTE